METINQYLIRTQDAKKPILNAGFTIIELEIGNPIMGDWWVSLQGKDNQKVALNITRNGLDRMITKSTYNLTYTSMGVDLYGYDLTEDELIRRITDADFSGFNQAPSIY